MPSGATPTQTPINGMPSLPGTGGAGEGQSSGQGQAKMIIGSFQAIVAPFDPSMMASIAGGMGQLGQQNPPQLPNLGWLTQIALKKIDLDSFRMKSAFSIK